ncbi:Rrf2 family transcriptional regulator [Gorillibacterium sp. sgz5001074]|uniref:Rrf2 family transcriptional regulator n=1 Tax=Gorillibacterium sp. sgz5001074 TaxID=3446695 RepID=UPI003F662744
MKKISSRFSVAVHILSVIAASPSESTGDYIAGSVNTNPVIIRRIMGMLKKAGLVDVRPGVGGAALRRAPGEITLLDVYRAVEVIDDDELFHIHEEANPQCPIGRNIESALREELAEAQRAMERRLAQVTLQSLAEKFK